MSIFHNLIWFGLVGLSIVNPPVGGLGLLFGYVLADKIFALINVADLIRLPLFITEPVLGVLLIRAMYATYKSGELKNYGLKNGLMSPWTWFYVVGVLNTLMGLLFTGPIFVLRDAVIVFYGCIAQIAMVYTKRLRDIKIVFFVVAAGVLSRLLLQFVSEVFDPGASAYGLYASFVSLGCLATLPLWGRFRGGAIALILLLVGIMAATEIRTVWVGFFIAYSFLLVIQLILRVPFRNIGIGAGTIGTGILCSMLVLRIFNPLHYGAIKDEFKSMFAGENSPNLLTRVAMWEDAIEQVVPGVGKFFNVFDRKVLNPFYFGSETRPEHAKGNRNEVFTSQDPSATDILMQYEKPKPVVAPVAPAPAPKPVEVAPAPEPKPVVAPVAPPPAPKPVEVVKAPEPKPVVAPVAPPPAPKPVELAKAPEPKPVVAPVAPPPAPKPVEVAKTAEPKPVVAPVAPPPAPKPVEAVKAPEPKPVVAPVAPPPAPKPVEVVKAAKPKVVVAPTTATPAPAPAAEVVATTEPSVPLSARIEHELEQMRVFVDGNKALRLMFGVPFGHRFIPERISSMHKVNRYDPHNSFIAVFYRTGLVGFILFLLIIGTTMWRAFKALLKAEDLEEKYILLALMTCLVYHMGHSLTDVTLENPFRGAPFWVLLGLLTVVTSLVNKKKSF